MFASRSREHLHSISRQAGAIGALGVERGHLGAGPSEDRAELCDGGAVVGGARGARLAQAMRRAGNVRPCACFPEPIAKGLFRD
jgi:hypothetical protein